MSIALDTALYLREQHSNNPLTITERGILFTLMFRVGSNPFSWVSQETLAIELDVDVRNVKRLMKGIKQKGYIEIIPDPKDKRKNLYRPAEFLINYHQKTNRAQTKKYGTKLSPIAQNRGQNYPLNTGQNYPLSDVAQNAADPATIDLQEFAQIPKDTIERDINKKDTFFCATESIAQTRFDDFWSVYPRKKDKKRAQGLWVKGKLDDRADLIIEDIKERLRNDACWKDVKYIPHPSTYLKFERWSDEVTLQGIPSSTNKFNAHQYAIDKVMKRMEANKKGIAS